jgi:hypothetical protein
MCAELEAHIGMLTDDYIRRGMAPDEARRAALVDFGGIECVKETVRDQRRLPVIETTWQDLRYAARTIRKTPGLAAVAILSLALGIGANTAIYSVVDAVLVEYLPVKNPQELVEFVRSAPDGAMMTNLPGAIFRHFREDASVAAGVFAFIEDRPVLRAGGLHSARTFTGCRSRSSRCSGSGRSPGKRARVQARFSATVSGSAGSEGTRTS